MIDNSKGNYRFLQGGGPFSSGCLAAPGYEVVHAAFHPMLPLERGFQAIEQYLKSLHRPIQALCGMELRIPEPLSTEGFNQFNEPYIARLKGWNIFLDDLNPVARTNVALETNRIAQPHRIVQPNRIAQPSIHGFSYTVESKHAGSTFVIAGAGELKSSKLAGPEIVRRADTSKAGLTEKAETVLDIMSERLASLGMDWSDATAVDIYSVYNIHEIMESTILPRLGPASRLGVHWYYARPPVIDLDFEMDVRGIRQEIVLP